ncbi:MAG: hypothetical protein QOF37_948, partial [Thermoleophilaceae bacterium]|nr:hypothetical protein [Thermoleophilaceae bacterium]
RVERRLLVPVDLPRGGPRVKFTGEQVAAVELREGPLFLHAGAGSGKTRVLVERFVRFVCEDEKGVDRLLAITFTEKAAAELKSRIRERFLELGEREHAREAERAWVSTIHGFCSRLLRANALAAGIDPDFRVLDESRAARLAIDAFDRALEDFVRAGGERLDLAASYTPDKLERMVRTVYSRLRSQGQTRPELPPVEPPAETGERARLEAALGVAGASLAGAGVNKTVTAALGAVGKCTDSLAALPAGRLGDPIAFEELRVKRGNALALRGAEFDELAEAMDAWLGLCKASRAYADYVLLAKLVDRYGRHYAAAKADRSALDFEDLELRARDLLRSDRLLRSEVRSRFDGVMVDEFQDTNELQNELLDLVSDGNLFTVGDELQSIYGFRNADVDVFRRRRDVAEGEERSRRLATSFRAHPDVLDVVNRAFASVWGDYPPLAPGREAGEGAAPGPPRVDLLVVDGKRPRWEGSLEDNAFGDWMLARKVPPWRAAEARLLAKRIGELAGPGRRYGYGDVAVLLRATRDMDVYERALTDRGIPTYATGGGGYWSQQQISDLRAYLAALANPRDERSLYTLLASPLVGASLDALALIRFRAHVKGGWHDAWNVLEGAFLGGDGSDGLAGALAERDRRRIEAFVQRFSSERAAAPRMSLETLIDRAVTESGYDRAILELHEGDRRMANVRKLMRLAREYEAESGRDLRGFIDFVDEQELLQAREGEAPIESEDAVLLMTVHAAKGLEFPVVCVADMGRGARNEQGPLQVSTDGRVGLQLESLGGGKVSAPEWERIKQERDSADEAEEKRIFYVAMTRAEEHLVVSGATDTEDWPEPKPLGIPMDWAWRALAPGLQAIATGGGEGAEGGVRCSVLTPVTVDALLPPADRVPGEPDRAPLAGEEVRAARRPAFAPVAAGVPLPVARLSYSALESYKRCGYRFYLERVVGMRRAEAPLPAARAADGDGERDGDGDGQLALAEPPAPPAEAGLPPRVRGTVVHELLEAVDFRRPAPPARDAVERRLRAHGIEPSPRSAEELAALVAGALRSPVAERLSAARRVRAEVPFAFELAAPGAAGEPLVVDGYLDVHAEEDGGALIVDYKTDALRGRPPADATAEKYAAQRLVYALAALRGGAARVEVVHLFLERPDQPASVAFEAADVPRLERELIELAEGVVAARFERSDEPHRELCQGCPGQPALCTWGPDRTMAERAEGETFGDPEPVDVRAGVA